VQEATLDNVRFWLERGVDGLRLDAINFCFHDPALRDNPAKPAELRTGRGFSPDNPYAYQYHWYNNTQPENLAFLRRLRELMDEFDQVAALGEISSEDSLQTMAEYTGPDRLHMGYSFELLTPDFSVEHVRRTVNDLEAKMTEGWPCWSISNHDSQRVVTRWGGGAAPAHMAAMLSAMVCSLRGSVCVYQGEELGLPEAEIPFEQLQDPYGIAFWPNFKGRDGCRTPMPWRGMPCGGFSESKPWLPVSAEHLALNVESQEGAVDSPLQRFRRFLAFRRGQAALRWGEVRMLATAEPVLAFERVQQDERLLCVFNLSAEAQTLALDEAQGAQALDGHGLVSGALRDGRVELPGYGAVFARL
jgi:alpha-glucosidase